MMFWLVAVALVSTYFGVMNLHPIELRFLSHKDFFATKSSKFTLMFENNSSHDLYDLHFKYKDQEVKVPILKAFQDKALCFETTFMSRGIHSLEEFSVVSFFPLFHEKKSRTLRVEKELLVYPNPEGESLFKHLSLKDFHSGDIHDFKGISRYKDGENFSTIHWASLAKNEKLMSKRFIYTQRKEKLHFSISQLKGTTENNISQLTKWILEASQNGFDFTLELHQISLDSTKEDIGEILEKLALY